MSDLEGHVCQGLGEVVRLERVPAIEVFPHKHVHLQGNCKATLQLAGELQSNAIVSWGTAKQRYS